MLIFVRWLLIVTLFCSNTAFAKNKVVVVPLFEDGSSHEHPDMDYVSLSAAAFQPKLSSSFYSHSNVLGLLTTNAGPTEHILFVANLTIPNRVKVEEMTAIYRDGDTARDVEVMLTAVSYSDISSAVFAEVHSTGFSFSQFTRRSAPFVLSGGTGPNPINNQTHAYFVQVALRNGAALRGVTIGYKTEIE